MKEKNSQMCVYKKKSYGGGEREYDKERNLNSTYGTFSSFTFWTGAIDGVETDFCSGIRQTAGVRFRFALSFSKSRYNRMRREREEKSKYNRLNNFANKHTQHGSKQKAEHYEQAGYGKFITSVETASFDFLRVSIPPRKIKN